MRKLLEVLRLSYESKLSGHKIAESVNLSRRTVGRYLELFNTSGLTWPLSGDLLNEEILSRRLNPNWQPPQDKLKIDFAAISKELRQHKHVTLLLLWEELRAENKLTLSYSRFAAVYRAWLGKQPKHMRQMHLGGDKVFVDYSGDRVTIIDTDTGQSRTAEIFVGVLGASGFLYLEATWTQQSSDWIMSHVRMFEAFGGVPRLVVPDNLRSGVTKPDRYDPDINPAYNHMLLSYRCACMPARVRHPKDKPHAEGGVLIIQRWILARLRHEQIYGLADLNARLRSLMEQANNKKYQLFPETRSQLFRELDKPNLQSLPRTRYVYREYQKCRVGQDYHVFLLGHYYSVPYSLINKEVDAWYNSGMVEFYYNNICVAKHIRSTQQRGKTTEAAHMAPAHQKYAELTVEKMQTWAQEIGHATQWIVARIQANAEHQELACRRSHGLLNLSKKYSPAQLEAACAYAQSHNIYHYEYIEPVIRQQLAVDDKSETSIIPLHGNIRGAEYYC